MPKPISDPRVLMKLRKPMYGLGDAPRAWFEEAPRRLLSLGFTKHPLDACLFLLFDTELRCAIGLHVDDLLGIVDPSLGDKVKEDLQRLFAFRDFPRSASASWAPRFLDKQTVDWPVGMRSISIRSSRLPWKRAAKQIPTALLPTRRRPNSGP